MFGRSGVDERRARALGSDEAEWAGAAQRVSPDRCTTVGARLTWLRDAGLTDVDDVFREGRSPC
jgi:tRNA (cmo5U34)-methyltransferase